MRPVVCIALFPVILAAFKSVNDVKEAPLVERVPEPLTVIV
jgi:hypothetical protein